METLLDEATAELGKLEFSPMLATIEIGFRIVKAVPLHATLRLDCEARARFPALVPVVSRTQAHAKALPALRAAYARVVHKAFGACLPRVCCCQLGC